MAREFNDYEKEIYGIVDEVIVEDEPIVEDVIIEDKPIVEEEKPIVEEEKPIVVAEVVEEKPIVEEIQPPYKSKKFIEVEDEAALFAKLNQKYGHTAMSSESKVLAYLKSTHPELEDSDIAFLAASDYGIGVDAPDTEDLDTTQIAELRKQEIARKQLTAKADNYFREQAEQIALDGYDPLELDPEYQSFRTTQAEQRTAQEARASHEADVITKIETNSKTISEITESIEIELDEGKLAVPVKFKLNEEKQKELADFAKRYTPTQAEYDKFNDPETGKFDYKGYMESIAPIAFAKDIAKAGMRQALAKDREQFIEKELKNSTLRNNDVSQVVEKKFDYVDHYFDNIAGR